MDHIHILWGTVDTFRIFKGVRGHPGRRQIDEYRGQIFNQTYEEGGS